MCVCVYVCMCVSHALLNKILQILVTLVEIHCTVLNGSIHLIPYGSKMP